MKLCLINNLYPPYSVGGAEKVVERIARERIKNGDEAVVITLACEKGASFRPIRSVEDGIAVYRFSAPNIFSYQNLSKHNFVLKLIWHKIDIFNFWSARIIKKILEQEKPDEVQTHNLMGIGFATGMMIGRLEDWKTKKIRWTHYLHDVQLVEPSGVLPWNHERDSLWQKIYSWIMKWRMGMPDEVRSPSRFLIDFYQRRGFFPRSTYHVARNTYQTVSNKNNITQNTRLPEPEAQADPPATQSLLLRAGGGQAINKTQTTTKFLFVGSLVGHKGIRVLMRAWDVVDKNLPAELHVVGDGGLKKEVEEWAREDKRVKVYGRLSVEDLEEVYKKCDVLIFPSICIENHPVVIDEAHEFGLRVIASDTGGVGEMVRSDDVLVRPDGADSLAIEMMKLLNCCFRSS